MSEAENTREASTNNTNESSMKNEEIEVFEVSETEETEETPPTATVGDRFTIDRIIYTVTSIELLTVEATGCSAFLTGALNIPETVTYNNVSYAVTSVGSNFNNKELTSITIPEGVTTMADRAFLGCSNVTTINLPSTLQVFTRAGFAGLETINLAEGNEVYSVVDGVLFKDDGTKLWLYPSAKAGSSYDIPTKVTTIVGGSFYYNQNLVTLTIPDTVTTIELCAFDHCQGLQDITIGEGVTSFGEYNLYSCDNLETVTLKGSYVLGHHSINNCPKLTTITIDGQMRGAAAYALYNLPALEQYIVLNSDYFTARDGVLFNGTRLFCYPSAKTDTTYVVPDGTTEIMALAFNFMQNTHEVILPPGVYLNGGSFAFPNETTPMQIYFRDTESVSMSKSAVFNKLAAGSKIYGANQTVVDSINSYTNAINPAENATVEIGVIPVESFSLETDTLSLILEENVPEGSSKAPIVAKLEPYWATEEITWESSDPDVATVSNGIVTATGVGTATITATVGTYTDTCVVEVTAPLYGIELSAELTLKLEDTYQLTVHYIPEYTTDDKTVTWESSDSDVVTVSDDGTVTAVGLGTAIISAKVGNETASCTVTVKEQVLPFTDVKTNAWFYQSVRYVFDKGIMTGTTSSTFAPYEPLARAQFAIMLHRLNGAPKMEYTKNFPDVKANEWFTDAVLWAHDAGIITGYSNTGRFGPADNINREQLAVMLYRYAKYKGYSTSQRASLGSFSDASKVNGFAKEAMQWAVGAGIISGKNNETKLDPQGNATRAECATIIMRFMEQFEKI